MTTRRSGSLFLCLCMFVVPVNLEAQGFGAMSKKKISLHRKLPAAVHLTGTGVKVEVAARDPKGAELANRVSDLLTTELLKYDTTLQVEPTHPDDIVSCTITNYSLPPTQTVIRNTTTEKKVGKSYVPVSEPHRYYQVNGSVDLTYQAKNAHNGRTIDSDVVTVKYAQEFDETGTSTGGASGGSSAISKSWGAIKTPWNKATGKSNDQEEQKIPTPAELMELLAHRAASRIAARLVNTDEQVEVLLARGKLDDANKLADSGLWTRMLESLEQMTPMTNKEDDAYRLYNIGVAYEALGYQSDNPADAKKFFDQAAINYGKAIDDKPSEKYFLEPQNRIETALAHYRKLEQTSVEASAHAPHPEPAGPKDVATKDDGPSRNTSGTKPQKAPVTNAAMKESVDQASGSGSQGGSALTNDQVIKLFKAGIDEDNLIATINEARSTNLDVSVDGQVQLVNAGIKGKLLAAIRRKAALQKSHK